MTPSRLRQTLDSIVREYGLEQVSQSLREIELSEDQPSNQSMSSPDRNAVAAPKKARSKATAPGLVAKMDLPAEKEAAVVELAKRFEDKAFMPTFGDISNFCQIHGIDEPASRSRANAIPRVFKFIASMDADEIQRILDDGLFSGPSRLGPIADAIRSSGRARRTTERSGVAS